MAETQPTEPPPTEPAVQLVHDGPESGALQLVLAHGAGAGMHSPFMEAVARGLADRGLSVVRFEFPYMRGKREGRAHRPDRPEALLRAFREVIDRLGGGERLVIGGKSLGGRIASMLADEVKARGLVCMGYPFHPAGRPATLRTAHLGGLRTRALIVQGTRDELGSREEIAGYRLSPSIELHYVEDGDHSLRPRKRVGGDPEVALARALDAVAAFIARL